MKNCKLVRDRIPEILELKGIVPSVRVASDEEFRMRLREKLQEEVDEFLEEPNKEELADILEVVYALCDNYSIDRCDLEKTREDKAIKNGAFEKDIFQSGINFF